MLPALKEFDKGTNGIYRVIEAYHKYLPKYGVEFVDSNNYDLLASHAGRVEKCDIAHVHGLYWTGDYKASRAEFTTNKKVIENCLYAREITVPSDWVAQTFARDLRVYPHVIPHGIDIEQWKYPNENLGYILWNKNRIADVCSPKAVKELANAFKNENFWCTISDGAMPENVNLIGVQPHNKMKQIVQGAGVYLSTTKETFGIGILEALASGIPVLGYDFGGNSVIIEHGVNGYLAQPDDISDLIEGLNYCLKYRDILGANARESAKKWTWKSVAQQVYNVYELAMVEEKPTVAIIIPCYELETVDRAITSAITQTYNLITDIVVV